MFFFARSQLFHFIERNPRRKYCRTGGAEIQKPHPVTPLYRHKKRAGASTGPCRNVEETPLKGVSTIGGLVGHRDLYGAYTFGGGYFHKVYAGLEGRFIDPGGLRISIAAAVNRLTH